MSTGVKETIGTHLRKVGVSRRDFLQLCSKVMVGSRGASAPGLLDD